MNVAELYKYKQNPTPAEAERLRLEFDRLFKTTTGYAQLDDRIAKTLSKKDELERILSRPELPLHNNAAELAAPREARNRDVILQTLGGGWHKGEGYLSDDNPDR